MRHAVPGRRRTAFLRVGAEVGADRGELVVVVRASDGGVAWRTFALRAAA
jgi:hypothetical protein